MNEKKMNEIEKFLIFMSFNEIPNKKQETLLELLEDFDLEHALSNPKMKSVLSSEEMLKLLKNYDPRQLNSTIENMLKCGIAIVTIFSENYPQTLFDLPERPLILYAKGNLSLLKEKCLAVVGTRNPTAYGKLVTERFSKKVAESGVVIVSGLCYGVDAIAHRAALDVGGKTIAVIAGGFNHIYPATNFNLGKEIAEKGLLLSEYPPSFEPKRYTFPKRNRIIAGISAAVLITEAGIRSGTLHTKEYALEYGRDMFAIPGNITSDKSDLPNDLISSGQADGIVSPEQIVKYFGMQSKPIQNKFVGLSFEEQEIVNLLEQGEQNFDFLADNSKIPVNILNSCLTTLEIRGLIRKLPSQMYGLLI